MKYNKKKVFDCLLDANGNTSKAMVIYIMKYGCNGFKCKKCPLYIACDHYPSHSQTYALMVLKKVDEVEQNKDK